MTLPSDLLDITGWKISIPVGPQTTQIVQPQLDSLSDYHFRAATGVVFTVAAGASVLSGAVYPRSELREMIPDGSDEASWGTSSGTHTMTITQRINHLPAVKPQLIAGQIHDASAYVILLRVNGSTIQVDYNDPTLGFTTIGVLDSAYVLGTVYTAKIVVSSGSIKVYYNNVLKVTQSHSGSGMYYKAGCYLQTNPGTGDDPGAYGQVEIMSLSVTHV